MILDDNSKDMGSELEFNFDESYIVEGIPGSGKATIAVTLLRKIREEQKGTFKLIVPTNICKQYFLTGLSYLGMSLDTVTTWKAWNIRKENFDFIIVYGAHKFSIENIFLLKEKVSKAIIIFGETKQFIPNSQQFPYNTRMDMLSELTGLKLKKRIKSYTITRKNALLAESIIRDNPLVNCFFLNRFQSEPRIHRFDSSREEIKYISKLIENKPNVVVLFRTFEELENVYHQLKTLRIDIEIQKNKYSTGKLEFNEIDFTSDKPKMMTYFGISGIKFQNVILPQCSLSFTEISSLYDAITHCSENIFITYTKHLSSLFDHVSPELFTEYYVPEDDNNHDFLF